MRTDALRGSVLPCAFRVFKEIFDAVFINKKIGLHAAGDANDVFIVVLDPAANFFSINQLHHHWGFILRQLIDIFRLPVCRFRGCLPAIAAAGEFRRISFNHVCEYGEIGESRQASRGRQANAKIRK